MIIEKACWERGCACYDYRLDEGVEVTLAQPVERKKHMTIHNWGIEYCKSYAEQLRDKTHMHRAVHAAECIEYLLSLVQKEWVGLTDEEIKEIIGSWGDTPIKGYTRKLFDQIETKLKEKNT